MAHFTWHRASDRERLTALGHTAYGSAGRMLRYLLASIAIAVLVVIQFPAVVQACGEKLLALGRGIRFQSRQTPRPATVLLYVPQSATGQPLSDPNLETALEEAGHAVRAATTTADLESALRSGTYDVVLANVRDAPELERAQAIVERNAVILQAVYLVTPSQLAKQQTKADRDNASRTFGVVVEVPGRPGHYCAAVDKAMELKLKREKSSSRRP